MAIELDRGWCRLTDFNDKFLGHVGPFFGDIVVEEESNGQGVLIKYKYYFYGFDGYKLAYIDIGLSNHINNVTVGNTHFYKPDGTSQTFSTISNPSETSSASLDTVEFVAMSSCSHGAFITFCRTLADSRSVPSFGQSFLFTTDNRGKSFIVCSRGQRRIDRDVALRTNLYCWTEGDESEEAIPLMDTTYIANPNIHSISSEQLVMRRFSSLVKNGITKYTPYAYYKERGLNFETYHEEFRINNETYLSNGFWIIQD